MYETIPEDLPIAHPYPLPFPAPPPPIHIHYARPIPPEVNERIASRLRDPIREKLLELPIPFPDKSAKDPVRSSDNEGDAQAFLDFILQSDTYETKEFRDHNGT